MFKSFSNFSGINVSWPRLSKHNDTIIMSFMLDKTITDNYPPVIGVIQKNSFRFKFTLLQM